MHAALQGTPDRPFLHSAVERPWLVEDDGERAMDFGLLDIGLRCHAVDLAEAVEKETPALAPLILAPSSKPI